MAWLGRDGVQFGGLVLTLEALFTSRNLSKCMRAFSEAQDGKGVVLPWFRERCPNPVTVKALPFTAQRHCDDIIRSPCPII